MRMSISIITVIALVCMRSTILHAAEPRDVVVDQLQGALGIKENDLFGYLKAIAKGLDDGVPLNDVSMSTQVDGVIVALNRGNDPDVLIKLFLPHVHIQDDGPWPLIDIRQWPYGTERHWRELILHLLKKAESLAETSPPQAQASARAALLLSLQGYFRLNVRLGHDILVDVQFVKILGLKDEDLKKLRKDYNQIESQYSKAIDMGTDLMRSIDKLIESPKGPLPTNELAATINKLESQLAAAGNEPGLQWETFNLAWNVLNLARDRKDAAAIRKLETLFQGWQLKVTSPHAKRWIGEALQMTGPAPEPMLFEGILGPDGIAVPKPAP